MTTLWIADGVLVVVLLTAVLTDVRTGKIPNWLTYPAVLAGLAIWAVGGAFDAGLTGAGWGLWASFAGLLVGFLPMMFAFYLGGIGGGDAKLAGAIGALARWRLTVYGLCYGFLATMLMGIAVMILRRVSRQTMGRGLAVLLAAADRRQAGSRRTDAKSPRIPTALPWAVGVIWAMIEQHACGGWTVWDVVFGR